MKRVSFVLDGQFRELEADPELSVLSLLRDDLGCLGVRPGCLMGRCGSCTVLVDNRPIQSCSAPVWSIDGRTVATVAGAEPGSWLARVREVFLEEQAAQCGYCVNGIVTTVAGLLANSPVPDRDHLLKHLDEHHLCRCGAHVRMLRAIDRLLDEAHRGAAA